ncbi:MAG: hypothetical protein FJX42_11010, partial [Alphaproteobacteria bacterium]|nr:hypothetical protein [Alphaproteobacteria bacterium]
MSEVDDDRRNGKAGGSGRPGWFVCGQQPMRIGLLGDRNHAAHMLRLIGSDRRVTSLLIYHPDPSRANAPAPSIACPVERTSDISILSKCDAIVIASPSPTHAGFLRKFVPLGKYVLCEKPPVADMVDLEWLRGLSMSDRARTL